MSLCCRCNAGGKCINCVKSKRQCTTCLPSRRSCCSNTKHLPVYQVPVYQVPDTNRTLPAPPAPAAVQNGQSQSPSTRTNVSSINTSDEPAPQSDSHGHNTLIPISAHPSCQSSPTQLCPLPLPTPTANPSFFWDEYDSTSIIASMSEAYSEVVHWRRNIFTVPFGNAGKAFVTEISRLFRAYAEGSALECISMKACTILPILILQKPFHNSKAKDHSTYLERRMTTWNMNSNLQL